MKRRFALLPLMAVTALSLSLAACDDKKDQEVAEQISIVEETIAPEAVPETAESAMPAPVLGTVEADSATSFATAEGARTGAVFVTLKNTGSVDDVLVGATSDKATMVEIHESYVDEADGTMQMRKVTGVPVPASGSVELKPGGLHIMLIDILAPLVEGETFNITLKFENAGEVVVPVTITAPGATAAATTPELPENDCATSDGADGCAGAPAIEEKVPGDVPAVSEDVPVTTDPHAGH